MNRLSKSEREGVRNRYASELLYKLLRDPARELESEMKSVRLTVEELFLEVFDTVDSLKEYPEGVWEDIVPGLWKTYYCDLRNDMNTTDVSDEEIKLAASEIVYCILMMLSTCKGSIYNDIRFELSSQLNENHPEAYIRLQNMFAASMGRLGEEKVCARIAEYMDSEEEWMSDYLEEIYDARLHPQPQVEGVINETIQGKPMLTNRQLIILFEHMLNVSLTSDSTNIKALANLLSAINGRSANSIRTNIRSGIDYASPAVHNDIDLLEELVRPVSPTLANLLKNSKEEK